MAMASRKNLFKLKYQEWFGKVIIIKLGKHLNVFDKLKSDCNQCLAPFSHNTSHEKKLSSKMKTKVDFIICYKNIVFQKIFLNTMTILAIYQNLIVVWNQLLLHYCLHVFPSKSFKIFLTLSSEQVSTNLLYFSRYEKTCLHDHMHSLKTYQNKNAVCGTWRNLGQFLLK